MFKKKPLSFTICTALSLTTPMAGLAMAQQEDSTDYEDLILGAFGGTVYLTPTL